MSTFDREKFSERLRSLRTEKGYTSQKDFASAAGVSSQSINFYEAGKRLPDAETLYHFSNILDCPVDYLIGRSDVKKSEHDDASKKYGLSEAALEYLMDKYSRDKSNSLTLTINTLLENEYLLGLISRYLYYNWDSIKDSDVFMFTFNDSVPTDEKAQLGRTFTAKYRYSSPNNMSKWTNSKTVDLDDPLGIKDVFTNDTYKRIMLIEIQSELEKLLAEEDKKQHFKS